MRLALVCATVIALAGSTAELARAQDSDAARYQRCVIQVKENAEAALEAARAWMHEGGGVPAGHCAALALIGLGHAAEAAARIEELAANRGAAANLLAELYDEAGNAWLIAGEPARAASAFSSAIGLAEGNNLTAAAAALYYADRARALLLFGNPRGARLDLDRSIALAPNAAALTLRARLKREGKDFSGAANDLARALALDADFAEGYLERGRLGVRDGRIKAAREDFLKAAMSGKDGVAEQARREIEALELRSTH